MLKIPLLVGLSLGIGTGYWPSPWPITYPYLVGGDLGCLRSRLTPPDCPICGRSWPKALRRPSRQIECSTCRLEKLRRFAVVTERLQAEEEARMKEHLAKVEKMSPPERESRAKMAESLWA